MSSDQEANSGWRLYLDSSMDAVEILDVAGGRAAVFCTGRPGREGGNQDAALVAGLSAREAVLGVADGAGGLRGGERAARIAITSLTEALSALDEGEDADESGAVVQDLLVSGLEAAHGAIVDLGVGAGTTFVGALIDGDQVRTVHVGDSVALLTGQNGKRKYQTVPHSPVGYAVEAGLLNEREAIDHQDLHLVSNLLGVGVPKIEVSEPIRLESKDTLIIASDGLFDNMMGGEVIEIVRSGELGGVAVQLVEETLRRMVRPGESDPSKPDDLTIILYRA